MRSVMASSAADRRHAGRTARCRRSRTISDFEHFRSRDSASISETRGSGSLTVNVFMLSSVLHSCRSGKTLDVDRSLLVDSTFETQGISEFLAVGHDKLLWCRLQRAILKLSLR